MPAQSPARILTVEDDPIVRADLRLVLEDAGFEVLAAYAGFAGEPFRGERGDSAWIAARR